MDKVTGKIYLIGGTELPGARVEVWLPQHNAPDLRAFSDDTDEHGNFAGAAEQPLAGTVHIRVRVSKFSHAHEFNPAGFVVVPTSGGLELRVAPLMVNWESKATLAWNEPPPVQVVRAQEIRSRWQSYPWTTAGLGIPLVSAQRLPFDEKPTPQYLVGSPTNPGFVLRAERNKENNRRAATRHPEERLPSIDAFRDQYDNGSGQLEPPMPRPRIIADDYFTASYPFPSDRSFAWQRLAGANPFVLRLLTAFPKSDFPIEQADLRPYFADRGALHQALQDKRLYITDYEFLAGVPELGAPRYLPAPFALFYYMGPRAKDGGPPGHGTRRPWGGSPGGGWTGNISAPLPDGLVPVAIQIDRNYNPVTNKIFTPLDDDSRGNCWGMAKLMVQVADINFHEVKTHLVESHLVMEAFKVAMERTLSSRHPLSVLLRHHFEGLIAINYLAFNTLIAPGGGVDELLANNLDGSFLLARRAHQQWNFQRRSFRGDLVERGVLDRDSTIPVYPYRDDGMRIWHAIRDFVNEYLLIYYAKDRAVSGDSELGAWLSEMNDKGVRGLPQIGTRGDLADFLADVIFNCSARHAAVNFPQYDYFGFIPNMPGAAYARPIRDDGSMNTDPLVGILPPARETRDMVELMSNLSLYHYGQLGTYPGGLRDADANDAAGRFLGQLHVVQGQIDHDNNSNDYPQRQRWPYPYLMPFMIPNSTNI